MYEITEKRTVHVHLSFGRWHWLYMENICSTKWAVSHEGISANCCSPKWTLAKPPTPATLNNTVRTLVLIGKFLKYFLLCKWVAVCCSLSMFLPLCLTQHHDMAFFEPRAHARSSMVGHLVFFKRIKIKVRPWEKKCRREQPDRILSLCLVAKKP